MRLPGRYFSHKFIYGIYFMDTLLISISENILNFYKKKSTSNLSAFIHSPKIDSDYLFLNKLLPNRFSVFTFCINDITSSAER